jgi:hypothetical protein
MPSRAWFLIRIRNHAREGVLTEFGDWIRDRGLDHCGPFPSNATPTVGLRFSSGHRSMVYPLPSYCSIVVDLPRARAKPPFSETATRPVWWPDLTYVPTLDSDRPC